LVGKEAAKEEFALYCEIYKVTTGKANVEIGSE
jgi:hypothetical protein